MRTVKQAIIGLMFSIAPLTSEAASVALQVRNTLNEARLNVPVTWSVPFSVEQNVVDTATLRLTSGGAQLPAQFTPLARWGGRLDQTEKPLSWVLVDTRVNLDAGATLRVRLDDQQPLATPSSLSVVRNDSRSITIVTGAAIYEVSKEQFHLFESVTLAGGATFGPGTGLRFNGRRLNNPSTLAVEHAGPERISLIGRGTIEGELEYTIRMHFYRELAEVKVDLRVENLNPPLFDGQPQANNYGSVGSAIFDDLSIVLTKQSGGSYQLPAGEMGANGVTTGEFSRDVVIVQESSGDENWNALRDLAPRLQSGARKRASTIVIDGAAADGPNQIAGWLDSGGVTVAVERAWQNFPKAFRATREQIEIGLFPGEYSRNHELRAGEFKTHTFWIRHHPAGAADVALRARSFLAPARLAASPEHISRTFALGFMAPRLDQSFPAYESGVDYQIRQSPEWRDEYPARTVLHAVSLSQSYGWVDYGDIPTDFEVMTSPYNMKYDALRGLLLQAVRSDDPTWWEIGSAAARHVADIDVHHARVRGHTTPRAWFEGGIYGHGFHYENGRLNPHRNYMNPSSSMAGPAAGLFLWGLISGDTLLLDSAKETADNLYWKTTNTNYDESISGASSCARQAGLQLCEGDCSGYEAADVSRTGGNIIQAMITAYQATGESDYLDLNRRLAAYVECIETSGLFGPTCNRFHFQTIFIRNLGHYLVLRDVLDLPVDTSATRILERRMEYMTGTLWDSATGQFRMCYFDDVVDTTLIPIEDNWLFSVADAFAVGSIVLRRPELLTNHAQAVFRYGSENQFYAGSANSYHSTKEFVNQVGFGQMFLGAWWRDTTPPPGRRRSARR